MPEDGGLIMAVEPGSPADRAGVAPGERLLALNEVGVSDLIDYLSLSAAPHLVLTLSGPSGIRKVAVDKGELESLGLSFAGAVFDGIRRCRNRCVFCFVDQLPAGLRPSLYVKDEDYRLSFLQGNYVTLCDLAEADSRRILTHRLSPLYVSVHATDPEVRGRLLGREGDAPIIPRLREMIHAGIRFQAQAVICPGWNDGPVLARTIDDLAALWPGVESLAVVPVGLTAHRRRLTPLQPFDKQKSLALLRQIGVRQEEFLASLGTRFVFAADEFYLLAKEPVPPGEHYEDYFQLENGVGLLRSFEDDFRLAWRRWRARVRPGRYRVVTGVAAGGLWQRLGRLMRPAGVELEALPVPNRFFGESVNVTGLLAGGDIARAIEGLPRLPSYVPRVTVQRGGDLFLDGMTVEELRVRTGVEVIETDPSTFLRGLARARIDE